MLVAEYLHADVFGAADEAPESAASLPNAAFTSRRASSGRPAKSAAFSTPRRAPRPAPAERSLDDQREADHAQASPPVSHSGPAFPFRGLREHQPPAPTAAPPAPIAEKIEQS